MNDTGFFVVFLVLVLIIFHLWLITKILSKAGYNRWYTVLMLVPVVNIIMIWVFAFDKWVIKEIKKF